MASRGDATARGDQRKGRRTLLAVIAAPNAIRLRIGSIARPSDECSSTECPDPTFAERRSGTLQCTSAKQPLPARALDRRI